MSVVSIDVSLFRKMVTNGAINLKNNHAEVDALNNDYSNLEQEHAKTKDALVRMVVTQGNSDKPKEDESGGSNPKTIEEIIAEVEKEAKK